MAKKQADLPELTGCKVVNIDWQHRSIGLILAGKTDAGLNVDGAQLRFDKISNFEPLRMFLTASLKFARGSYEITGNKPVRLPARLTDLRISRAAKIAYGDSVYSKYYGAPRKGSTENFYLLALAAPRFRKPFPIVCARATLVQAAAIDTVIAKTSRKSPFSNKVLQSIAQPFAQALLTDDVKVAMQLLTSVAYKRLGRSGLKKYWPRGWKTTVRALGSKEAVLELVREHLTIEPIFDRYGTADDWIEQLPEDFPSEPVRGAIRLFLGDPAKNDTSEFCSLYFVEEQGKPRIGLVH